MTDSLTEREPALVLPIKQQPRCFDCAYMAVDGHGAFCANPASARLVEGGASLWRMRHQGSPCGPDGRLFFDRQRSDLFSKGGADAYLRL